MGGFRDLYNEHGVADYYLLHGSTYKNPHEPIIYDCIGRLISDYNISQFGRYLDLACGDGAVTRALIDNAIPADNIMGCDPYTYAAYENRTNRQAMRLYFDQLYDLPGFDVIICSFALHLLEESRMPWVCYHISHKCKTFVVISPHKKPVIKKEYGLTLVGQFTEKRVYTRIYQTFPYSLTPP